MMMTTLLAARGALESAATLTMGGREMWASWAPRALTRSDALDAILSFGVCGETGMSEVSGGALCRPGRAFPVG